jgi:ABC-2 type transport system ATP-binding protein
VNAIETVGLTRAFGERIAVDNLTLQVPTGSVFGFIGPNGAGKTTTVRLLTALIATTSGTATVAGHRLGTDNDGVHRSTGILTETPGLYERLSCWQNLFFFAQLYDLDATRAAQQVERYLQMLGLWDRRHEDVGSLSKGMRQKLAIARALLHEPSVLFLDEPTANLDPETARMVRDFIKELREDGRTIFLTTHNLPEVDELCDLVCIFKQRLLRLDSPANLRNELFGRGTRIRLNDDPQRWIQTVRELPFVNGVEAQDHSLLIQLDDPDEQNQFVLERLVSNGARVQYVEQVKPSLEEVYLTLVGANQATEN